VYGNPSQSYGASPAIWDHMVPGDAGHILMNILDCTIYMASAGARAYNGDLGAEPPAGFKGQSPWWRVRLKPP